MTQPPNDINNVDSARYSEDTLRQLLTFARSSAKDEINYIEGLYTWALKALVIPLTGFLVLFSVVGWIGFTNLKQLAVQTATNVVKQRLEDKLTRENIDEAVQTALREHATEQINDSARAQIKIAVADQIAKQNPELQALTIAMTAKAVARIQPQIEEFAKQQAQALIAENNKPRTVSFDSSKLLNACAVKNAPITFMIGVGGDSEAQLYEEQIALPLETGGWKLEKQALLGAHLDLPSYGLVVVTDMEQSRNQTASILVNCLHDANIPVQTATISHTVEWGRQPILLVLPKQR